MPRTYGLLDLFTLAANLLAPFVDPLRAEFATRPTPTPAAPPAPAQVPAVKPAPAVEVPTPSPQPEDVPVAEPVLIFARVAVAEEPAQVVADVPATEAEPVVYVRKPAGKKWRYVVAPPNARGTTFRKRMTGRRTTYEPCH